MAVSELSESLFSLRCESFHQSPNPTFKLDNILRINANEHCSHWGSNQAEMTPGGHCGSFDRLLFVEIHEQDNNSHFSKGRAQPDTTINQAPHKNDR
jgi:hypothetical protein